MAKKKLDLETPFRKGEEVIATRDILGIPSGAEGKIQLHNGLGTWDRYWVLFGDEQVGQVDHNDLTRPFQHEEWLKREEEKAEAALRSAEEQAEESEAASSDDGGGGGGIASQIPAALLERSKAAKKRLLG